LTSKNALRCPRCTSGSVFKSGSILAARGRVQRYECRNCRKKFHPSLKTQPIEETQGYFDIESTDLNAEFGILLTWAFKQRGQEVQSDYLRRRTLTEEKRILKTLLPVLSSVDTVFTWYGTGFDLPMLRSRCMEHGLEYPTYMDLKHVDLYYVGRSKLQMKSNRLQRVAEFLGFEGKTSVEPKIWKQAMWGSPKAFRQALEWILEHNRVDVEVLEKVHERLEPYMTGRRMSA
jgi:uncharacterized protein YprB with RNaseH-like and TPR domain